jgi:hypothetical protein
MPTLADPTVNPGCGRVAGHLVNWRNISIDPNGVGEFVRGFWATGIAPPGLWVLANQWNERAYHVPVYTHQATPVNGPQALVTMLGKADFQYYEGGGGINSTDSRPIAVALASALVAAGVAKYGPP